MFLRLSGPRNVPAAKISSHPHPRFDTCQEHSLLLEQSRAAAASTLCYPPYPTLGFRPGYGCATLNDPLRYTAPALLCKYGVES